MLCEGCHNLNDRRNHGEHVQAQILSSNYPELYGMSIGQNIFDMNFFRGTVTRPHLWKGKGIVVLRATKHNERLYRIFRANHPSFEGIEMPSEVCFSDDEVRLPQHERQYLISGYKVIFKLDAITPGILRAAQILPELNSRYKATITYRSACQKDNYFNIRAILWQLNVEVVLSPESIDKFRGEPGFAYLESTLKVTGLINLSWNETVLAHTEQRMPIGDLLKFYNVPGPDPSQRAIVDVHSNREATSSEEDDDDELRENVGIASGHARAESRESRSEKSYFTEIRSRSSLDIKPIHLPPTGRPCCSIGSRPSSNLAAETPNFMAVEPHCPQTCEKNSMGPCRAYDEATTDDDDEAIYDNLRNLNEATYAQVWHRVNCSCCPVNREEVQSYQPRRRPVRRRSVSRPREHHRHGTDPGSRNCCDSNERERVVQQTIMRQRSHSVGMPEEAHCDSRHRNTRTYDRWSWGTPEMATSAHGGMMPVASDAATIPSGTATAAVVPAAANAVCCHGALYTPWQHQPPFYGLVGGLPTCATPNGTFVLQTPPVSNFPNAMGTDDAMHLHIYQVNESLRKSKRY
ncbi:uncharacterized protein LOC111262723 isoform X1 [Varroa jacobsoni]|uniref:uncharacterized protein LOC111262723 isoform X1 n=2 Tax=Varroa jacobsoni TaxID=62625 RepID=UPI000BF784DF|nr:uncharacterized protein LOC111262723 isoform X1 [Varroa jacobsoni]